MILGIQVLLNVDYNCFADFGAMVMLPFMIAFCLMLHRLCILAGVSFGIWQIDESVAQMERKSLDVDVGILF